MTLTQSAELISQEIAVKQQRVAELLERRGLDAVLLSRTANFTWMTGGKDSTVVYAMERGEAAVLITRDMRTVITVNPEAERLRLEEELGQRGFAVSSSNWWEGSGAELRRLTAGLRLGADLPFDGAQDVAADMARLRFQLLPSEIERYRELGQQSASCMSETCHELRPGMSELEIAGLLAGKLISRGIFPTVLLVGSDARVFDWKHPVATAKQLERYAMIVLCARRWGLIVSLTRFVHFGALPAELRTRHTAAQRIDAAVIAATRPGARVDDVFRQLQAAYAREGYADDWKGHWQGGAAGYEPREYEWLPGMC